MTPRMFAFAMKAIHETICNDQEKCHMLMEGLMCTVLRELGYDEGIDIFQSTNKWYA